MMASEQMQKANYRCQICKMQEANLRAKSKLFCSRPQEREVILVVQAKNRFLRSTCFCFLGFCSSSLLRVI